jgi:hypothetical protein
MKFHLIPQKWMDHTHVLIKGCPIKDPFHMGFFLQKSQKIVKLFLDINLLLAYFGSQWIKVVYGNVVYYFSASVVYLRATS